MEWPKINFAELFNGAMILGAFVLAWIGRNMGAKWKPPAAEPVELAGAVIDSHDAQRLEAAFDRNTDAVAELQDTLSLHSKVLETTGRQIVELGRDIGDLTREIIRTKPGG